MRIFLAISLGAAGLILTSCDLSGKTSASKTPATPKPAAAVAQTPPPAPPPPISTPQTEIQLPPAQPVSAEALATIEAPPEPRAPEAQEPEPAAKPTTRRPSTAAAAPKPESTAPAAPETPAVQTPPAAPAEERPRLQPVYSEEERRRILAEIERRKGEIENILRGINPSRIPSNQKGVIDSIHSFLSVSDDAAKRGDLRSADSLSDRALILARELASGR